MDAKNWNQHHLLRLISVIKLLHDHIMSFLNLRLISTLYVQLLYICNFFFYLEQAVNLQGTASPFLLNSKTIALLACAVGKRGVLPSISLSFDLVRNLLDSTPHKSNPHSSKKVSIYFLHLCYTFFLIIWTIL